MKIVIDIPDDNYKRIRELAEVNGLSNNLMGYSLLAIAHGTVLPEEHGDLIDRKELLSHTKCTYKYDCQAGSSCDRCSDNCVEVSDIVKAEIIIPANKSNIDKEIMNDG